MVGRVAGQQNAMISQDARSRCIPFFKKIPTTFRLFFSHDEQDPVSALQISEAPLKVISILQGCRVRRKTDILYTSPLQPAG